MMTTHNTKETSILGAIVFFGMLALIAWSKEADAGRVINSLPWSESFERDNYRDMVWITQRATHTWVPNAGFNGTGAAKFTAPMAEGYSGLGQILFASGLRPTELHVRFVIYHGATWRDLGPGGKLVIMNREGNRGRPMLIAQEWDAGRWQTWAACDGTVCKNQGGDYWPNGTETFRLGPPGRGRSHEWICVEFSANATATPGYPRGWINLEIWTQDGRFSGTYVKRPMDDSGIGGLFAYIDVIGGYMNRGNVRQDAENYFIIDELAVSTSRIGPPAGFTGGTTPPVVLPAPTNLRMQARP